MVRIVTYTYTYTKAMYRICKMVQYIPLPSPLLFFFNLFAALHLTTPTQVREGRQKERGEKRKKRVKREGKKEEEMAKRERERSTTTPHKRTTA